MGRTSASHRVSGGDSRVGRRPSTEQGFRRPSGANADGAPTVRNIIPWRDMEKKLAERLAAKAAAGELSGELEKDSLAVEPKPPSSRQPPPWKTSEIEPSPDSGVRTSAEGAEPPRDLTYSVYTLPELEARAQARPPRMSMAFAPPLAPQPSHWADVGKSGLTLVRAWWVCMRTPKPRPRVLDVCRVPLTAFLTDLKAALRALPWKKLGIGVGVTVGALVLLLVLVLTAAELTDDLKPRRSTASLTASDDNALGLSEGAAAKTTTAMTAETKPVLAKPAAAVTSEPAQIEIDDEPPPPAKAVAKPAAPKHATTPVPAKKPAPKKKGVELFTP